MNHAEIRKLVQRSRPLLLSLAAAGLWSGNAAAFQIETGNPDLEVRWDNTIRYNVGWRMDKRDQALADTWSLQAGEYKSRNRGDLVTNRVDLLTEFDAIFKKHYGFRVSGAGWYDAEYDDDVRGNPAYQAAGLGTAYPGNKFTNKVSRYYTHSGELLDAFVFGRLDLGDSPLDVRLGRHNIYWGESLFSPIHGVSYSQGPVDFRKALATPGSEAKELFLPLNQLSALWRVTDQISLAAQYYLEWKPYRLPEGGTYLSFSDILFSGGTSFMGLPIQGDLESGPDRIPKDRGDWGVSGKWASNFGTVGLYYRKFDDKIPQFLSTGGTFSEIHNAYAEDVKLWGVSLSKQLAGMSVGAEVVHRQDGLLNTKFGAPELARGDTWHALLNTIAYVGKTPLFDSATVMGEINYSHLDKVNGNAANFNHVDHGCAGGTDAGCATDNAWGISATFTPTWFQVLPSADLTMPIHYDRGIKGNSAVPFGGNEDSGSWSVGLGLDYMAKYKFDLTYTDYFGPVQFGPNPFSGVPGIGSSAMATANGNGVIRDRGWLSLTFKTTF